MTILLIAGCTQEPTETTVPTEINPTNASTESIPATEPSQPMTKAPVFYFSNALEMDRLYSMRTDGTDLTLILDAQCWDVSYAGDNVYFMTNDGLCTYHIPIGQWNLLAPGVLAYAIDGNDLVYSIENYGHPMMHLRHIDLTTLEDKLLLETGYTSFALHNENLYYIHYREDYTQAMMLFHIPTGHETVLNDKASSYRHLHGTLDGLYCIANDNYWAFVSNDGDYRRDNRIPRSGNIIHADENGIFYSNFYEGAYSLHYVDSTGVTTDIMRRTDLDICDVTPLSEGSWLVKGFSSQSWGEKNEYGYYDHYASQVDYSILNSKWKLKLLDCAGVPEVCSGMGFSRFWTVPLPGTPEQQPSITFL